MIMLKPIVKNLRKNASLKLISLCIILSQGKLIETEEQSYRNKHNARHLTQQIIFMLKQMHSNLKDGNTHNFTISHKQYKRRQYI